MPFPSDVITRPVSVGGAMVLESSGMLCLRVVVRASKSLVRDATGYRFEKLGVTSQGGPGAEVVINLPVTDQAGWKDPALNALIDVSVANSYTHQYTAEVHFTDSDGNAVGIPAIELGPFVVPSGDTVIDLDKNVPASTIAGGAVSIPDIWSQKVAEAEAVAAELQAIIPTTSAAVAQAVTTDGPAKQALNTTIAAATRTTAVLVAGGTDPYVEPEFPQFVKNATPLITRAKSGLSSIYWPSVFYIGSKTPSAPGKWGMVYSTDHDSGAGGIRFAFSNDITDPTSWVVDPAYAYTDTAVGDQTETGVIVWNHKTSLWHLYYQNEGVGINQSTLLATSPNLKVWTRVGIVLTGVLGMPGDGHRGYMSAWWVGDTLYAYHLDGGGRYGRGSISVSHDGINFVTDPRRLPNLGHFDGDTNKKIDIFHSRVFRWRGDWWAITQYGGFVSGFVTGGTTWVLGKLTEDFRSFKGRPRPMTTLGPGETEVDHVTGAVEHEGRIYIIYRANGALNGDVRMAVAEA